MYLEPVRDLATGLSGKCSRSHDARVSLVFLRQLQDQQYSGFDGSRFPTSQSTISGPSDLSYVRIRKTCIDWLFERANYVLTGWLDRFSNRPCE